MSQPQLDNNQQISARALLSIPDFRFLWAGQAVSNFGDAITHLTLVLYINHITGGSTQAIAWLLIALAIPMTTVGLVAGVFVDRWQRRRVMIISDLLRAVLTLGFVAAAVWDQLLLIYALALLHASVSSFFAPARSAVIPRVVPKEALLAANSLSQMSMVFFRVLGVAAAGFLVGSLNTFEIPFIIDAATFVISAILISRLSLPPRVQQQPARTTASDILKEMGSGLRIITRTRVLVGTMVATAVTMLGIGALNVLLTPMIVNDLELPETWFGAVELAQTAGMILGATLITILAARFSSTKIVSTTLMALGVAAALFYGVSQIWHLFPILFVVGLIAAPLNAAISTIIQTAVSNELLGRISGALNAVIQSSSLLSMFFAGTVAALVGLRNVFLISGGIIFIAGLASAWIFREYQKAEAKPGEHLPLLAPADTQAAPPLAEMT